VLEFDDCCMSLPEFIDWLDDQEELDVKVKMETSYVPVILWASKPQIISVTIWDLLTKQDLT
jgi:hypothetical protein